MSKFIDNIKLDRLAKALDNRIKLSNEELTSLINEVRDMLGGRSIVYLTQAEYDALSEMERNDSTINYFITDAVDSSHFHDNKDFLDSLTEGNIDADSIDGYDIWIGTTSELNEIEEKDPNTIYFEIYDGVGGGNNNSDVVQVDIVNGVLNLTEDKYQKTTMVNGTEVVFPEVSGFTEIHLYFSSDEDMNISFPECKWRMDHNIEAGNSYEIIAVYNTMEWLLSCVVYS